MGGKKPSRVHEKQAKRNVMEMIDGTKYDETKRLVDACDANDKKRWAAILGRLAPLFEQH